MERINFQAIEKKWQKVFSKKKLFRDKGKKFYCLEMFPYPSGKIHMGHVRNYTIGDVVARYKYLNGHNVLHPMGWDSFGLPAENASKQNNLHPRKWTDNNISKMKSQLKLLGLSIDWDLEISTCNKDYYKHQQEIFIDFFNNGLISRKETYVNWDPVEKTVLANEQVIDGKGWRSNTPVERKKLSQWFFNTTKFSNELLNDLESLLGWPEKVKLMQKNWIGKSIGCEIIFNIDGQQETINVFTTRPDTIFGASFIALSVDHPLSKKYKNDKNFLKFKEDCNKTGTTEEALANAEKLGFRTSFAINHPFNDKKIPVFFANFVLMDYGTGAIFGCPAHDQRDFDFANKYNLEIIKVVDDGDSNGQLKEAYTGNGRLVNSDFLNGLDVTNAKNKVISIIEDRNIGKKKTMFRLKDWGVSRQRYWGCPIPMIYLEDGSVVPVDKKELPIELPEDIDLKSQGNPLEKHPSWKFTTQKSTGKKAVRETDTLDTFVDSSWYFLRFCSPNHKSSPFDENKINYWMPVDQYIGGIEHAILHLLYSRFFTKSLNLLNKKINISEPFKNLFTQGMVCHETYKDQNDNWLYPEEIKKIDAKTALKKDDQTKVNIGSPESMSKSKKNTVDPETMINQYGADAVRWFILSDSPPEKDVQWSDVGVASANKFLQKFWDLNYSIKNQTNKGANLKLDNDFVQKFEDLVFKIDNSINQFRFNVSIALFYETFNLFKLYLKKGINNKILRECMIKFNKLIIPFVPHIAHECLVLYDCKNVDEWPKIKKNALEETTIAVQINGKTRDILSVKKDLEEMELKAIVTSSSKAKKFITNDKVLKIIYVKNRIINYIIKND